MAQIKRYASVPIRIRFGTLAYRNDIVSIVHARATARRHHLYYLRLLYYVHHLYQLHHLHHLHCPHHLTRTTVSEGAGG